MAVPLCAAPHYLVMEGTFSSEKVPQHKSRVAWGGHFIVTRYLEFNSALRETQRAVRTGSVITAETTTYSKLDTLEANLIFIYCSR